MPDFPGWNHGLEFVEAYRAAVRTRSRLRKRLLTHSPLILRTGPDEAAQALRALEGSLRRSSAAGGTVPCAPYAHVDWREGDRTSLIEKIAQTLRDNAPAEAGRLRLPTYDLVHSLATPREAPLPEHVYAQHKGRPNTAPTTGGGPSVTALFLTVPLESIQALTSRVHRAWWEWRWALRLSRGRRYRHLWPAGHTGKRGYHAALQEFEAIRQDQGGWDGLLLASLMTDLYGQARQGLLHPGRRRRRPRYALLLDGTRAEGNVAVADFVELFGEQQTLCPNPVTVLVAALPRVADRPSDPHGLHDAAIRLNPAKREIPAPFEVALPAPEAHRPTTPVTPVWTPWLRVRPRSELVGEGLALVMALWLAGLLAFVPGVGEGPLRDSYTGCLTGSDYAHQGTPRNGASATPYDEALAAIEEENRRAEREVEGRRIVTIAHVRSSKPKNENARRSGGTIPELRGLLLAQRALHGLAPADDSGIWVRIKLYDAGVQYAEAEERAREIIEDAEKDPQLIGVTGFTESRKETVAALKLLNGADIPIVTSTATAKKMEVGQYYHGAAPNNEREARVVSSFVDRAHIMRNDDGSCAVPEDVAVVTDPADVYSDELGKAFTLHSPSTKKRIGFTPGERDGQTVPNEPDLDMKFAMAQVEAAVCGRITAQPRTVVYWTSRVREFETFLDAFQKGDCANKDLTVVGGNELTNATLSGNFTEKSWLRLYHVAHVLPAGHPDRSTTAEAFNNDYIDMFGAKDLWLNDGHAALAYDSVRVLAQATSQAHAADVELSRANIQQEISGGSFDLEGASGRLQFTESSLQRPFNKLLTMVHYGERGSAPVLVCGAPGKNIDAGVDWRQGGTIYPCPVDD